MTVTRAPALPMVTLTVNNVSMDETGGSATVTATLSNTYTSVVTVNLIYTGTATGEGTDYAASAAAITIPAGSTSGAVTLTAVNDTIDEVNETVIIDISSVTNGTEDGTQQQTVTITDDDPAPSISINDPSVAEGDSGTVYLTFTVTLSPVSGKTVTVNYATADSTAAAGSDYTATSGTLTFNPGLTSQNVTVTVNGDPLVEPDETFILNLSGASNATISDSEGTGTITNDDVPTISISDASAAEGDAGTATLQFTVTLSAASDQTIKVNYATANLTAIAAGSDYAAASGLLSFSPGETTKTVSVTVYGDGTDEENETLYVNLSNATGADISDSQGVGTITDDDPLPSISINDPSVSEGNVGSANLVFTVTLSPASGKTVTVDYATADGTATAGSDYVSASGTLTFTPGETAKTVTVTVNGDETDEENETVLLNLTNATNATIADSMSSGTITNDDGGPPTITSATYNCTSGVLVVTGTNFFANGSASDIDASKITVTGEGSETYTLTNTSDVERDSLTQFTLTLSATDRASLNQRLNKNGTSSTGGTLYNLAAAAGWVTAVPGAADLTDNSITVSNVAAPTITSAVYNSSTGALTVTGTGFLTLGGANNDIDVSKLLVKGEGGSTRTLTMTPDVDIISSTSFTVVLDPADKAAVNQLLNKNGTLSVDISTYNLAAGEDWAAGADADVTVADTTGNGITVSGVTGISGITLPVSATYRTGHFLDFTVQFEAAVDVTYTDEASKPYIQINLNTGGPVRAYYQSGSGTSTLVFRYTVTSGELDSDGITLVSPINTNTGGAIKNDSDNNASLYFAPPSTANIRVDGVAPYVTGVSASTDNGSYKTGDTIAITVSFSENVMVNITPQLTLETGDTDRVASYASGTGTGTLTFNYTVQPGDTTGDLDYKGTDALALNLGTIKDAGGNDAVLTLPDPGAANSLGANKAIVIDTTAPAISSGTLSAGNAYIDLTFSEGVYGAADGMTALTAARFSLTFTQNGGTATNALISSVKQNNNTVEGSALELTGGETTVRVFLSITGTPNGLETIEIKPANGTSVYDKAGNAMLAAQTSGVKTLNDLTPPTLVSAERTDNTHITVTLSKNCVNIAKANDGGFSVSETGAPGTIYTIASIAQGSDASHVVLTVADMGVSAREGVTVKYTAADNGTVRDTVGNVMLTNGIGAGVTAWDTAAPVISSGTLSSGNAYIDLAFSEGVYGASDGATALTAGKLALTFTQNGGTATNAVISSVKQNNNTVEGSSLELTGGETTVRVFLTITGTPNGLETIELKPANASSVYDKGGSAALTSQTTGVKHLIDPTPPPPPPEDNGANVVVNGETYSAGASQNSTNDGGQTVTTVTVDTEKLQDVLENQGQGAVVTIPVTTGSQVASGVLTGQMVDTMEQNGATLIIETDTAAYTLPAEEINIGAVAGQLGENVTLADIVVTVSVSAPSDTMTTVIEDAAGEGGFALVVPAVEFTVSCSYNNQTVAVTSFNAYVERTIRIPDGVDPSKITTAVVVEPDGTTRHVPTQIMVIDGKYYAVINSLTNSVYSVIWNPVEFSDAADSWAKESINNMGSRMVITGVGNNRFEPDRDISRAEFAAIAVRALGLKTGVGDNKFADVKADVWYCPYIETAVSYGLITGCGDGLFRPGDAITREQAMTLIERTLRLTGLEQSLTAADISALLQAYPDSESVSGYAKAGVAACVKTGIVLGRSGQLAPGDFITRAEVAVIMERLLEKSNLI